MKKTFKRKSKIDIIITLLLIVFSLLLIISVIEIIKWYIGNKENQQIKEEMANAITIVEKVEENKQEYDVDFEKLKQRNKDTVAWLKVLGTNIEYPVVQASDNNYYLKRNFNKEYNSGGWVFADYKNKFDGTDKNIVIYGHNMKDNSMLGSLKNVLEEAWYTNKDNYIIDFITEKEQQRYEVFSVYKIQNEDYYINTEFTEEKFSKFIETLKNRSIYDFNVEINFQDSILTLSTCANNNNYRVVLHAKKIKVM